MTTTKETQMNEHTVVVRSVTLAAKVPWRLDVLCPNDRDDERSGEMTTDRAESSRGLPVVVIDGVAYGPMDLGEHLMVCFDDEGARLATLAGYTVKPRGSTR